MFMRQKKILIAQGGGPTMVINKSLVGIVEQSKKQKYKSIGAYNGWWIINQERKNSFIQKIFK